MTDQPASTSPARKLVLASASPRRAKLLRDAGYEFTVDASNVDEDEHPTHMLPSEWAMHLAKLKANAVSGRHRDDVVLAADTVVALGDQIIGKPNDAVHAKEILRRLGGATHIVITGVAVAIAATKYLQVARTMTAVRLRLLTEKELEQYLLSGLWRDKAGGYGLQDENAIVKVLNGSESNVVGLPMKLAAKMLVDAGMTAPPGTSPTNRET